MSTDNAKADFASASDVQAEIDRWRLARVQEYSTELGLIQRFQAEIGNLRSKVCSQRDHVNFLIAQNQKLSEENVKLKLELARAHQASGHGRLAELQLPALSSKGAVDILNEKKPTPRKKGGDPRTAQVGIAELKMGIEDLQREVDSSVRREHGLASMRLIGVVPVQPQIAERLLSRFEACQRQLCEPSRVLNLYFAGPLPMLRKILAQGFSELEPPEQPGIITFGRGWYFSRYASRAHSFAAGSGHLLLARVAAGNIETVVRCDGARGAPSPGYDSIIVPGRPLPVATSARKGAHAGRSSQAPAPFSEEYVIFDGTQAMPLHMLKYEATCIC